MADPTLPCLVCGKTLKSIIPNPTSNQPSEGTAFTTSGHYGSTVFDPMDSTRLEINVCDECLLARQERVLHVRDRRGTEARPWQPDELLGAWQAGKRMGKSRE